MTDTKEVCRLACYELDEYLKEAAFAWLRYQHDKDPIHRKDAMADFLHWKHSADKAMQRIADIQEV